MKTAANFNDAATPDVPHGNDPAGLAKQLFDELYKVEFGDGTPVDLAKATRLVEQGADLSYQHPELNQTLFDFLNGYPEISKHMIMLPAYVGQDLIKVLNSDEEDADDVRSMLEHGADLNQRGDQGRTPLMIAARRGFTDSLREIAAKDDNLSRTDRHGWNALMHAAMEGHFDAAKTLIDARMPVTLRSSSGYTALDVALVGGGNEEPLSAERLRLAVLLVQNGASLHQKNEKEISPVEYLKMNGEEDAIKQLTAAAAQYDITLARTAVVGKGVTAPAVARFRRTG
ncbi:MAG: ankyrin repeat domain-containing protein [Alphaproteobacteria bacterium]|nr:ankyrin repeat domain-containing protein [Alphaproteobacteria bacterium]